jgi:DNA-binding Xre family transcriptional regulator
MARTLSVSQVRIRARQRGIKNASVLARRAGIAMHTAYRWWNDSADLKQYDRDVLLKLCDVLECVPGDLIIITDVEQKS